MPEYRLGELIASRLTSLGKTQVEFAAALDVSQQTVSKWIAEETRPRTKRVVEIASVLGLPERTVLEAAGILSSTVDLDAAPPTTEPDDLAIASRIGELDAAGRAKLEGYLEALLDQHSQRNS